MQKQNSRTVFPINKRKPTLSHRFDHRKFPILSLLFYLFFVAEFSVTHPYLKYTNELENLITIVYNPDHKAQFYGFGLVPRSAKKRYVRVHTLCHKKACRFAYSLIHVVSVELTRSNHESHSLDIP